MGNETYRRGIHTRGTEQKHLGVASVEQRGTSRDGGKLEAYTITDADRGIPARAPTLSRAASACPDPLTISSQVLEYPPIYGIFNPEDLELIKELTEIQFVLVEYFEDRKVYPDGTPQEYRQLMKMSLNINFKSRSKDIVKHWVYEYGDAFTCVPTYLHKPKRYQGSRISYQEHPIQKQMGPFQSQEEEYNIYKGSAIEAIRLGLALLSLSTRRCACEEEDLTKEKKFQRSQKEIYQKELESLEEIRDLVATWIIKPVPKEVWHIAICGAKVLSPDALKEKKNTSAVSSWDPSKTNDLLIPCKIKIEGLQIYFAHDRPKSEKYDASHESRILSDRAQLKKVVQKLKDLECTNIPLKLKVYGYTDATGGEGYNKRLSQYRAAWVGNALKDKGVNVTSITLHPCGIAPGAPINIRSKKHRLVQIVVEESKK